MKLSPAQSDLLSAIKSGVEVHRADSQLPLYMRMDTQMGCTASAKALQQKGLARVENWRLILTDQAK